MKLKFKKLKDGAVIPSYAHEDDVGLDLTATWLKIVDESDWGYMEYGTSLVVAIPKGYAGLIFPRSSISKTGLIMANCVGVIDPGYQGEITFRFKAIPNTKVYNPGERVGQMLIVPVEKVELEEVENFEESKRGAAGYGSTGN